jgi:hypothetical protein
VIEVGFIIFLFYSNLLMGEFERSGIGAKWGVVWAIEDFNSHVHALVTTGDLQTSGSGWRPRIFFIRDKLIRRWQRLVIALLRGTLDAGQFDVGIGRDELEDPLQREETRGWIVHVQAFRGKEHFLRYAGRYVRRPPIAQWPILAIEDRFVRFWCKDRRLLRYVIVRCTIEEFIDRYCCSFLFLRNQW